MNWFEWAKAHLAELKAKEEMFSPRAQQALALARTEANRLNHNFIGTEHILLGIIKLRHGIAINVLQNMKVDLEQLRLQVEQRMFSPSPDKLFGNTPYTPRSKKVVMLAQKEAKTLHQTYVGTEHLLLGLLAEGEGVAARALKFFKLELEQTRKEALKELNPNISPNKDGQKDQA
jgi:ATP-dependent Clp protease ATP-binding subunit ClpC